MPDNIKKVTIANTDLPAIHPDGSYLIRFRIISKDAEKSSSWSATQTISVPNRVSNVVSGSIVSDNTGITIGWDAKSLATKPSFDIYLKWTYPSGTETSYTYVGTVKSNNYYTVIPSQSGQKATNVNVVVQQETSIKQVASTNQSTNPVLVYQGTNSTTAVIVGLPSSFDGGVIA
jgi:hypothetical protein